MSDGATEMIDEEMNEQSRRITLPGTIPAKQSAFDTQVGGGHYKGMKIQPVEFALANKLDFFQLNIVKYSTRRKGGKEKRIEDLEKAQHYLAMYLEAVKRGDIE